MVDPMNASGDPLPAAPAARAAPASPERAAWTTGSGLAEGHGPQARATTAALAAAASAADHPAPQVADRPATEPENAGAPASRRAMVAPGAVPAGRAPGQRRSGRSDLPGTDTLRKPVNALAIVPQSKRITPLFRKSYNVMLHLAQAQGMDRDVYRAPISAVLAGLDFDSNDTALVKRHLRAMATTAVEWQSPTTGEGASWAISGLIGHAEIKRERGQNWLEWSYSVRLKQELLEPSVFAKLALEIISQLRSHGAIALYEICSRYRDVGRTSRQHWTWWRPVLSGKPETDKQKQLEYRFFKRDVLKTAIAEVNAVTDLDVELQEYKEGRFIADLQFTIRRKPTEAQPRQLPRPLDMTQVLRASQAGIEQAQAEQWQADHGMAALAAGLDALERRMAHQYPEPLRDPQRYLKAVLANGKAAPAAERQAEPQAAGAPAAAARDGREGGPGQVSPQRPGGSTSPYAQPGLAGAAPRRPGGRTEPAAVPPLTEAQGREASQRRRHRWVEEWLRRRRESLIDEIAAMSDEAQQSLGESLLADMQARNVHPSIRKRLQTSGWQHAMVIQEMVRFYAQASIGPHWDQPEPSDLLDIAAQLGDVG